MRLASRGGLFFFILFLLVFVPAQAAAQEGALENTPPTGTTSEEIITRFAAREKLFKDAREHYTYRQDIKVQTRDGDTVTGEYHEVFDVLYDDKGHRIETSCSRPSRRWNREGCHSTKATFRISATAFRSSSPPKKFRNTTFSISASSRKIRC